MRTDLAYINRVAGAAVAREVVSPRLPASITEMAAKAAHTTVAGFTLVDESAAQAVVDEKSKERLAAIEAYKLDYKQLAKSLEDLGVKPLAVIPTRAWNEICVQSELYRLTPDKRGEIKVSADIMKGFNHDADVVFAWLFGGVALSFGAAGGIISAVYMSWPLWGSILSGVVVAVVAVVALFCFTLVLWNGAVADFLRSKMIKPAIRRFAARPWNEVIRAFLPDYKTAGEGDPGYYTKVVLPQPPADVVETLIKAKSLKLKVAAVADAISFEGGPHRLLLSMYQDFAEKQAEQRTAARAQGWDPIIYCEHKSATAIIAQFGDFPVEQEVVDQVLDSEYLL